MVFQNYALYPHMKVFDNMAFSLKLAKVAGSVIQEKVAYAAQILNLTPYLDRYPRQLSGGQRQRVAMGRAIVRNPKVFLFDEPLSNLDAQLRVQMRTEIKALHQRLGSTSIYVTHDQIEAMTMADKIVVMRDGHIEQAGPPLEVYDRPCNSFVASFIGSPAMNLIQGIAAQRGKVPGSDRGRHRAAAADRCQWIRRPGGLLRSTGPPRLWRPDGIDAIVGVVEPTGANTLVFATIGNQKVCASFSERYNFRPGDRIGLVPRLDCVHLFDRQSGINLMP